MRKSPTGNAGFTLLELLLALSIGSIVAAAVYGSFHTAIKAKTRAEAAMKPLRTARYVFSAIKRDLQNIAVNSHVVEVDCNAEHCSFPVSTDGSPMQVSYLLNRNSELIRELRAQAVPDGSRKTGGQQQIRQEIIGRDVRQLQFERQIKEVREAEVATLLIGVRICFADKPDPLQFHYAILVEQALLP